MERRKGLRLSIDVWSEMKTVFKLTDVDILQDNNIPEDMKIVEANNFEKDERRFFLEKGVVPVLQGEKKGLLVSELYIRIPAFVVEEYLDFVALSNEKCVSEYLSKSFNSKASSISTSLKPMSFIEEMILKMNSLSASDVTISWRTDHVNILYSSGSNIMDEFSDNIDLSFAEKIRVSLINLSYERPSESIIDGKFSLIQKNTKKEYRLSVLPTIAGHSIVIRSYQVFNSSSTLETLGYTEKATSMIKDIVYNNSDGLFLLTGPTGSGKTTTIYSLLQALQLEKSLKIKTAEDPVEIQIDGIDQCQINNHGIDSHKITYTKLLRGFMRQKPDVIMVGEIRDTEVANICIESALTGHFVVSTLHTGDVKSTFGRLTTSLNVGHDKIEDSLIGILNQRLVPKLCSCKKETESSFEANVSGCNICNKKGTPGYDGEIVVSEVVSLKRSLENWKEENFKDYYSYSDCGNDLFMHGSIDKETLSFIKRLGK